MILAVDSTAKDASVCLYSGGRVVGEINLSDCGTHSESLLPAIEFLMKTTHTDIKDIDVFACAAGPGSFTGVRIGAATIKGLAFGRGCVCCGVSTLEAIAYNASGLDGIVCAVMDARRQQVYTAIFKSQNGEILRLSEDSAMSVYELAEKLKEYADGAAVYLIGDGFDAAYEAVHASVPCVSKAPRTMTPHLASSVAVLAEKAAAEGKLVYDVTLTPSYLRLSQAEREYNEKHGI